MKVIYKKGPCSHKQCCPKGDTHQRIVELGGGARFERGGAPVTMDRAAGEKLISDHPGMFAEEGNPKVKPTLAAKK